MQVRIASKDDIAVIRHIAHETWPVAYRGLLSEPQLAYMLELIYSPGALDKQFNEGHIFFIAETDEEVAVGFAGCSEYEPGINWKLHKLYVLPHIQKSGAGKALMQAVIQTAKEHHAAALLLNVKRDNPAYHYYLEKGFRVVDTVDIPIGEGYFMRDYVMMKEI
ncbi:MAG TPA: GNAT family N-acetyltransferase [Chitinophagaceae bacterium]|nr:GNAT family N-acetyltransferase [Chitinophagaceae bacterium]